MTAYQGLDAEFTDVFKDECRKYQFPDGDVANAATLVISDPEVGYVVCVAPKSGASLKCAEIRAIPWTYKRNNVSTSALLVYLQVKDRPPYFIRLIVDDICEITLSDPQKIARWIEAMMEFAHAILQSLT